MTRIAGVPEELESMATLLAASAPELQTAAMMLASAPLPAMPPGVAAATSDALDAATRALGTSALISAHEGLDLRRRSLWLRVADTGGAALWSANTSPFKAVLSAPLDALDLIERRKALQMLRVWKTYLRAVRPIEDDYGAGSEQAFEVTWRLRRRLDIAPSRFRSIVEGGGDLARYERDAEVPLAGVRLLAGRVLGPAGVVAGFYEIWRPSHPGWKRWGDRASGAAGALGSAGGSAIAYYGLETTAMFVPGVDVVAATLLLGSAGWEIYTHKKEIAHALVSGGSYVLHHPVVLAGPAGVAAEEVWDHRQQLASAAVSTASWGEHRVEDAAAPAVSVAKGAYHEGGRLLGKFGL